MKKVLFVLIILLFPVLASAGIPTKADVFWLSQNIYHEARGESDFGKLMIGLVTLKRLDNGRWGDTVKDVVTAHKQFSWYSDGKCDIPKDKEAYKRAKGVAILSYVVYSVLRDDISVLYYHNNNVSPYWAKKMVKVAMVENHTFYKE